MSEKEQEQADLDARLWNAARTGDAEAVVRLAGEGASADAKGGDGDTPAVAIAAANGRARAVRALAQLEADLDARDDYGKTALMAAAEMQHLSCVSHLLDYGADTDLMAKDNDGQFKGQTALERAEEEDNAEVVELLRIHALQERERESGAQIRG